jgi:hypothetical protein
MEHCKGVCPPIRYENEIYDDSGPFACRSVWGTAEANGIYYLTWHPTWQLQNLVSLPAGVCEVMQKPTVSFGFIHDNSDPFTCRRVWGNTLPAGVHELPAGVNALPAGVCEVMQKPTVSFGFIHDNSDPFSCRRVWGNTIPAGVHELPAGVNALPAGVCEVMQKPTVSFWFIHDNSDPFTCRSVWGTAKARQWDTLGARLPCAFMAASTASSTALPHTISPPTLMASFDLYGSGRHIALRLA